MLQKRHALELRPRTPERERFAVEGPVVEIDMSALSPERHLFETDAQSLDTLLRTERSPLSSAAARRLWGEVPLLDQPPHCVLLPSVVLNAVAFDHLLIPTRTLLWGPGLCSVIDEHDAKALRISKRPFEVVE